MSDPTTEAETEEQNDPAAYPEYVDEIESLLDEYIVLRYCAGPGRHLSGDDGAVCVTVERNEGFVDHDEPWAVTRATCAEHHAGCEDSMATVCEASVKCEVLREIETRDGMPAYVIGAPEVLDISPEGEARGISKQVA